MNRFHQSSGWLMIFDRRTNAPALENRLSTELAQTAAGKQVTVIRANSKICDRFCTMGSQVVF